MVNLIDQDCGQVDIPLEDSQKFVSFIDRRNREHKAIINVLIRKKDDDDEVFDVCQYTYENPFEKK